MHAQQHTIADAVNYVKMLEDSLNWTLPGEVNALAALIEQNHEICIAEPDFQTTHNRTTQQRYVREAKKLIKQNYGWPGVTEARP